MKKKGSIIAVLVCMVLIIGACVMYKNSGSESTPEEESTRAQVKKPEYQGKLDLIEPSAYNNVYGLNLEEGTYLSIIGKRSDDAYWKELQKGVEQAAADLNAELGYEGKKKVKVTFNAPSDPDNVDEQVNILDEELSRYPAALAISVADLKACEVQFDLATESDIPVVVYDSGTDYDGVMSTVATDNSAAATEVTDKMAEDMEQSGEVIIFAHDSKSMAALSRTNAFMDEVKAKYPNISVVDTYALDQLSTLQQKVADEVNAGNYKLEEKEVVNSNDTDTDVDEEIISVENQEKEQTNGTASSSETANSSETASSSKTTGDSGDTADSSEATADENLVQASDITEEDVVDYILAKHPNVKGIYATNSEAMEVALNGIDRAELDTDKLTVMGFDINDAVKVALEAGVVDGVVLQNPFGMGYASVIATARAALGMANEANVNTGYTWLTKDNYKDKEIQKMLY